MSAPSRWSRREAIETWSRYGLVPRPTRPSGEGPGSGRWAFPLVEARGDRDLVSIWARSSPYSTVGGRAGVGALGLPAGRGARRSRPGLDTGSFLALLDRRVEEPRSGRCAPPRWSRREAIEIWSRYGLVPRPTRPSGGRAAVGALCPPPLVEARGDRDLVSIWARSSPYSTIGGWTGLDMGSFLALLDHRGMDRSRYGLVPRPTRPSGEGPGLDTGSFLALLDRRGKGLVSIRARSSPYSTVGWKGRGRGQSA